MPPTVPPNLLKGVTLCTRTYLRNSIPWLKTQELKLWQIFLWQIVYKSKFLFPLYHYRLNYKMQACQQCIFHKTFFIQVLLQPRSQGSLLPALWSERERERPWKTLVTCLPESGRLQTNDLGEGQVSVRFVSTERRQVSAAIKLCTWPDLERGK